MRNGTELFAILKQASFVSATSSKDSGSLGEQLTCTSNPSTNRALNADLFNRMTFGVGIRVSSSAVLPLRTRMKSFGEGVREGSTVAVFSLAWSASGRHSPRWS